ncbi:MAG: acyltransferase family protein [Pseudomonadales bacterium]
MQANHKYRSDIDGLRALAVVPVVFYHAGFAWFSGGFVGVDVFFVISGYLITSIIAREIESRTFSLAHFYERRARRLFPALFTVVGASVVAAWMLLMPWELEDFGESVATTALFTSNFLFFTEAGYFDGPAELKPLLHTWSLAIEEQYYLLYPGFLILLQRLAPNHFLHGTLTLFVGSLLISIWSTAAAPDAAFYLLPSRTWELMLGSILALLPAIGLAGWLRTAGGLLGIVMILAAVFGFDHSTPFPGLSALLPCVGTALIIFCGGAQTNEQGGANAAGSTVVLSTRVLSWKPLVWIGLISYSLYLWHWPVLVFAKHYFLRPLHSEEALLLVGLSFLLAYLSWRWIEKPFRGSKGLLSRSGIARSSVATMALLVTFGLVMDQSEGLPGRLPAEVLRVAEVADDKPARRGRCEGIKPADFSYQRLCRVNELEVQPTFIVWGDSHAMAVMPEIGRVALGLGRNGLDASSNGCVPLLGVTRPLWDAQGECLQFADKVVGLVEAHPEIRQVILIARWARHSEGTVFGAEGDENFFIGTATEVARTPQESVALYRRAFRQTVQRLQALGREVVVLGAVPEVGQPVPDVQAKALWRKRPADLSLTAAVVAERQANVRAVFAELQAEYALRYYPVHPYFCTDSDCDLLSEDGLPLYFDDNHLSSTGARRLRPVFEQALAGEVLKQAAKR